MTTTPPTYYYSPSTLRRSHAFTGRSGVSLCGKDSAHFDDRLTTTRPKRNLCTFCARKLAAAQAAEASR